MLYIKLFIEREKNIGQSAPECPFKCLIHYILIYGLTDHTKSTHKANKLYIKFDIFN